MFPQMELKLKHVAKNVEIELILIIIINMSVLNHCKSITSSILYQNMHLENAEGQGAYLVCPIKLVIHFQGAYLVCPIKLIIYLNSTIKYITIQKNHTFK